MTLQDCCIFAYFVCHTSRFVFPGIGLGSLLAQATSITDTMIEASAIAVSESLTHDEEEHELLYPRITLIREISTNVALKVIRTAQAAVSLFSILGLAWR